MSCPKKSQVVEFQSFWTLITNNSIVQPKRSEKSCCPQITFVNNILAYVNGIKTPKDTRTGTENLETSDG